VSDFSCRICSGTKLEPIAGYTALPRVTSDCKPWPAGGTMTVCLDCGAAQKRPDAAWFDEIDRIYKAYQIYDLSSGSEQVIFNDQGVARPRSHALVDFVIREARTGSSGTLIDIGCGNGAALANFSSALPGWSLYGTELSDAPLERLKTLPNFGGFYTEPPRKIDKRFDIVTMIHALEHMPEPLETLQESAGLLSDGGQVFVEIPNVETSLFDLLIADHMMHFSPAHLAYVAGRAGLKAEILRDDVLPKEITMLASRGKGDAPLPDAQRGKSLVEGHIDWLSRVIEAARAAAEEATSFGIFGTSISGMWLYGALRDRVSFFVDEDVSRLGGAYDGRPILSPENAPVGSTVFMPFNPNAAASVYRRLKDIGPGRIMQPPPMDKTT
jgi:SAM-dependent methyltransferase